MTNVDFHEINLLRTRLSAAASSLQEGRELVPLMEGVAEDGAEGVRQQVEWLDRIDTGKMINSIGQKRIGNRGSSPQFIFGFILGEPDYTKYQEGGTVHIEAMMAMDAGRRRAEASLQDMLDSGDWVPSELR